MRKSSIHSIASEERSASHRACSGPNRSTRSPNRLYQLVAQPQFLPLAPNPQVLASISVNIDAENLSKGEALILLDAIRASIHAGPWPINAPA